jgi:hypothetical protein
MSSCASPISPPVDPSIAQSIEELPLSPSDVSLLSELRAELARLIPEYRSNRQNPDWLKKHKIPQVSHWRSGILSERFQDLPDDENVFGTTNDYLPPVFPWSTDYSALDSPWPDRLLIKYLRARSTNVTESALMFLRMCIWRDDYGTSECFRFLSQPWRRCWRSHVSNTFTHRDKDGRPVYWEKSGLIDAHHFSTVASVEETILTHVWFMEWQLQLLEVESIKRKKRVDQVGFIIDLNGCGLGHRKLASLFTSVASIDQNYYPEMLKVNFMINCPRIFPILWALVKPLLDKATTNKFHIHGYSGYQEALRELLGPENVPKEYGGECECRGSGISCLTEKHKQCWNHDPHSPEYNKEEADTAVKEEMENWKKRNGIGSNGEKINKEEQEKKKQQEKDELKQE